MRHTCTVLGILLVLRVEVVDGVGHNVLGVHGFLWRECVCVYITIVRHNFKFSYKASLILLVQFLLIILSHIMKTYFPFPINQ